MRKSERIERARACIICAPISVTVSGRFVEKLNYYRYKYKIKRILRTIKRIDIFEESLIMSAKRSSWAWANDEPVVFNDFDKASTVALEKLRIPDLEEKNTEAIIEEIVAGKRKRGTESPSKKRAKKPPPCPPSQTPKPLTSRSLDSTSTTFSNDDEDIEWSDGDELEMNKTLDLLISDQ